MKFDDNVEFFVGPDADDFAKEQRIEDELEKEDGEDTEKNKHFINPNQLEFYFVKDIDKEYYNSYYKGYERFSEDEIELLKKEGISAKLIKRYGTRFDCYNILTLHSAKISPEKAKRYDTRFEGDIAALAEFNVPPKKADRYSDRFSSVEIALMYKDNISPKEADQFLECFNGFDIINMYSMNISPKKAEEYKKIDSSFEGEDIALLKYFRIKPEELKQKSGIANQIKQLLNNTKDGMPIFDKKEIKKKFKFVKTGSQAALLMYDLGFMGGIKNEGIIKFSPVLENEGKYLAKIRIANPDLKNIIKLKCRIDKGKAYIDVSRGYLDLEYIHGGSLEELLKKSKKVAAKKVLKYSAGIMNGLIEMRRAGIYYHRDIRPGNILIDGENDRAVICDLGIATTDKRALAKDNRRYGGKNDLISLGQIMYKMATGNHLFAESPEMERTIYAEKIRDYRDKVYSEPALLEKHLERVDKTVENEEVRTLIKSCLTAKNYDYGKMQKMFARLK